MTTREANGHDVGVLWLALVVGMVLHFNYGVSGIRYGISFEQEGATGVVPWSNFMSKAVFYVVPLLLAAGAVGGPGRAYRNVNVGLACLFTLANGMHLVTTASAADDVLSYAQVVLLAGVLVVSLQLIRISLRWRMSP